MITTTCDGCQKEINPGAPLVQVIEQLLTTGDVTTKHYHRPNGSITLTSCAPTINLDKYEHAHLQYR